MYISIRIPFHVVANFLCKVTSQLMCYIIVLLRMRKVHFMEMNVSLRQEP